MTIVRLLHTVEPYDWPLTLRMIGAHTVPGTERLDLAAGTYARLVPTAAGPVAIELHTDTRPRVLVRHPDAAVAEEVVAGLRHWLDLDHDPATLSPLGADPVLGPLLARRPGIRRVGYPAAFEAVLLTILGQQVSLAAGRTFAGRLTARYGEPGPAGLQRFPSADRLASTSAAELQSVVGVTGARARSLLATARAFAENPRLAEPGPLSAARRDHCAADLAALPGVGPWTVAYLQLRLLGDRDALPAGDLVLRRALGGIPAVEVTRMAERWRPWRSYAVFSLWAEAAFA